jgi:hypothetical protein
VHWWHNTLSPSFETERTFAGVPSNSRPQFAHVYLFATMTSRESR